MKRPFRLSAFMPAVQEKHTPLLLLVVALLGFGLLSNRLGYYQDDWPYIFYAYNKGISSLALELYYDSRPNAAWLYIGLFKLLGFKTLWWHLFAVLLRWLSATLLWLLLRHIWRDHVRQVTFAILLFIVHPFFLIQPYAVNSILYWSGYLLFSASLLLMAWAASGERPPWLGQRPALVLTVLGVLLEAVHLFTSEYFVGMVLVRPLLLFWLLKPSQPNLRRHLTQIFKHWAPYLAALGSFVIWRLFLYVPPPIGDRNNPEVLFALFKHPLTTLWELLRTALQDTLIITFSSWYRTLTPELFAFPSIFSVLAWLVGILAFAVSLWFLKKMHEQDSLKKWFGEPLLLGILLVLLGMLPIWIIGENIVQHKNQFAGSRFGIGSTLGAALILAALIEQLVKNRQKTTLVAALVALAVSMHLFNAREFAYSWEKQQRLTRELIWRAPDIEPGTAIVTDEEILGFMGSYSVSFSLITSYAPHDPVIPPYWYFPFYYTDPSLSEYLAGKPLEGNKLTMDFKGNSRQMLVLAFNPELNRCLWILNPNDTNLRLVKQDMRQLSAASDLNLIHQGTRQSPPAAIFGRQETQTWCYFFEKADLARQYQQWPEIARLWKSAQAAGEQADNGFEYIPFIEGYGQLGDWGQVKTLTKSAKRITAGVEPSLCSALDRLQANTPATPGRDQTLGDLKDDLKCANFQ